MADYPTGVYAPRTKENKAGVVYDADKPTIGFAEDVTKLDAEVVAIETELGASPKGTKASVVARLNDVDTLLGDHSARHENGGADEISVAGLSGALADAQTPTAHQSTHEHDGADPITGAGLEIEKAISFFIDGGGSAITTGIKGSISIPFKCEILKWTLAGDQSGSIVIDIWKDTKVNYPPTDADSITGDEPPILDSAIIEEVSALSAWNTTINAGDILMFNVDSATTITWVSLTLKIKLVE